MRYWLNNVTLNSNNNLVIASSWNKCKASSLFCGNETLYVPIEESINSSFTIPYLYVIEDEDFKLFDYDDLPGIINDKKIIKKMYREDCYVLSDGTTMLPEMMGNYYVMFKNCDKFEKIINMYDKFTSEKCEYGGGWNTPKYILIESCPNFDIHECGSKLFNYMGANKYAKSHRMFFGEKIKFTREKYVFFSCVDFTIKKEKSLTDIINDQQYLINDIVSRVDYLTESHNYLKNHIVTENEYVTTINPVIMATSTRVL